MIKTRQPKRIKDTFILVVDDAKIIRDTGIRFLEEAGYRAEPVIDGYDLMAVLIAGLPEKPDVILLDIMMSRIDGWIALQMIRANEKFKDTIVIMVSSNDGPFDKTKGQMLGCDDYITKPFKKQELYDVIQKHLPVLEEETPA